MFPCAEAQESKEGFNSFTVKLLEKTKVVRTP